jgi:hypothetical protein
MSSHLVKNSENPYAFPYDEVEELNLYPIDFKEELAVIRADNPNLGIDTLMTMLKKALEKKKNFDLTHSRGKVLKVNKKFFDCAEGIVRMMDIGLHNV